MIEATSSFLTNVSALRASAGAASAARVQEVAQPKAFFYGPEVFIDSGFNKVITSLRDSVTGNVIKQFPAENILRFRSVSQVSVQTASVPEVVQVQPAPEINVSDAVSSAPAGAPVQQSYSAPVQTANVNAPSSPASFQTAVAALSAGALTSAPATTTVQVDA